VQKKLVEENKIKDEIEQKGSIYDNMIDFNFSQSNHLTNYVLFCRIPSYDAQI